MAVDPVSYYRAERELLAGQPGSQPPATLRGPATGVDNAAEMPAPGSGGQGNDPTIGVELPPDFVSSLKRDGLTDSDIAILQRFGAQSEQSAQLLERVQTNRNARLERDGVVPRHSGPYSPAVVYDFASIVNRETGERLQVSTGMTIREGSPWRWEDPDLQENEEWGWAQRGGQGGQTQANQQPGSQPAENPQDRFTVDRGPPEFDYDGRLQELISNIRMTPGVPQRIAEMNYQNAVSRATEQVNAEQRRHNETYRGTGSANRGTRQRSEADLAKDRQMADLWEQVAGREEWTPTGGQRVGGLSEEQSRALRADPEGQRFLDQLTEWKTTGNVPDDFRVPASFRNQSSLGAAQPVQDPYAYATPYGQASNPATANPLVPSAQNFLPPPPVDPSWGSPGAQQQMFNNSMMAWTMPKQDLLQWGQQAAQMPWSPNYGNLPEQFRPSPYSIEPNNAFGVGAQGQQNRDAFIQSILNSQANQFTGTYQGNDSPGRFNQVNYDPSVLWQQATGLLNNGFVNPFRNPAGG